MEEINAVRKRYFTYMQRMVRIALEISSPENDAVAESAIRRYSASLLNDYETMWKESEWLLMRANYRVEKLEREIACIQRFHGINQ